MRQIDLLLLQYAECHQHRTNVVLHEIAVPCIYLVTIGLLWSLPVPVFLAETDITWAHLTALPVLYYYFMLSGPIGAAMTLLTIIGFGIIKLLVLMDVVVWQFSLSLFVIMWMLQFAGHRIEGKKPSFINDIRFLLVGPAWWWTHWFRRLRISW